MFHLRVLCVASMLFTACVVDSIDAIHTIHSECCVYLQSVLRVSRTYGTVYGISTYFGQLNCGRVRTDSDRLARLLIHPQTKCTCRQSTEPFCRGCTVMRYCDNDDCAEYATQYPDSESAYCDDCVWLSTNTQRSALVDLLLCQSEWASELVFSHLPLRTCLFSCSTCLNFNKYACARLQDPNTTRIYVPSDGWSLDRAVRAIRNLRELTAGRINNLQLCAGTFETAGVLRIDVLDVRLEGAGMEKSIMRPSPLTRSRFVIKVAQAGVSLADLTVQGDPESYLKARDSVHNYQFQAPPRVDLVTGVVVARQHICKQARPVLLSRVQVRDCGYAIHIPMCGGSVDLLPGCVMHQNRIGMYSEGDASRAVIRGGVRFESNDDAAVEAYMGGRVDLTQTQLLSNEPPIVVKQSRWGLYAYDKGCVFVDGSIDYQDCEQTEYEPDGGGITYGPAPAWDRLSSLDDDY